MAAVVGSVAVVVVGAAVVVPAVVVGAARVGALVGTVGTGVVSSVSVVFVVPATGASEMTGPKPKGALSMGLMGVLLAAEVVVVVMLRP